MAIRGAEKRFCCGDRACFGGVRGAERTGAQNRVPGRCGALLGIVSGSGRSSQLLHCNLACGNQRERGSEGFFSFYFYFFIFAKTCCPYALRSGDTHRSSVRIHLQGLGSWRRISQNHEIRNRPSPEAWLKSPKSAPRTSGANSFD